MVRACGAMGEISTWRELMVRACGAMGEISAWRELMVRACGAMGQAKTAFGVLRTVMKAVFAEKIQITISDFILF